MHFLHKWHSYLVYNEHRVTRVEIKIAQFFPKVARKVPTGFYLKSDVLKSLKSHHTFRLLLRDNLTQNTFKNHPMWSHWKWNITEVANIDYVKLG